MLLAGNLKFQELTESTIQRFESQKRAWDNFDFFGSAIKKVGPAVHEISQKDYIRKIGLVQADARFDQYCSIRAET